MLKRYLAAAFVFGAVLLSGVVPNPAIAAGISQKVAVCDPSYPDRCTISGFLATGTAAITATTTTGNVQLGSTSGVAVVVNTGAVAAYVKFGGSTVTVTTANGYYIPAGGSFPFATQSNTYMAAITASSTADLKITTGIGSAGAGGGGGSGGGGGGGGAITAASGSYAAGAMSAGSYAAGAFVAGAALDGWDAGTGLKADTVCATATTATCTRFARDKFIAAALDDLRTAANDTTTPHATAPVPSSGMGCTLSILNTAATTNSTNVKASAGTLCSLNLINPTTTLYYVRLYNLSAAPTCSSSTGFVGSIALPPAASAGQAGGVAMNFGSFGAAFTTGIGYCVTLNAANNDNNAAVAALEIIATYK